MPKISVCLIAKNESNYLIEWVAYYRNLGADHIVIYDNKSSDNSVEILKSLQKNGIIEFHQWNFGTFRSPQIMAYRHAVKNSKCDWILFIDADEFLVLKDCANLAEFVLPFHHKRKVSGIAINWRIFGDSNLANYDARPIIERFCMASKRDFFPNHHVKCIYRISDLTNKIHMHLCETKNDIVNTNGTKFEPNEIFGLSKHIDFSKAQINHYYGKTIEEYHKKMARGQAACRDSHKLKFHYNLNQFHENNRNDEQDLSAFILLPALKVELAKLNKLINQGEIANCA